MKVLIIAVGKVRGSVAEPIAEYEQRTRRHFTLETAVVREAPVRQESAVPTAIREEGRRLLSRVPAGYRVVALHREGVNWSSLRLAAYLEEAAVRCVPGIAFLIGGAYGLSGEVLERADTRLSLSSFTLPHELARLVLTEQLYRAGTIQRGEPYHKPSLTAG